MSEQIAVNHTFCLTIPLPVLARTRLVLDLRSYRELFSAEHQWSSTILCPSAAGCDGRGVPVGDTYMF